MRSTDPPKSNCSCEWHTIRRDLAAAQGDARGWQWARLWKHYLDIVLDARRRVAKGDLIHNVTIDETDEFAGEDGEGGEFRAELDAWNAAKGEIGPSRDACDRGADKGGKTGDSAPGGTSEANTGGADQQEKVL